MKTASGANLLVKNQLLMDNGIQAYIPRFLTQKDGVVRDVDTTLTEKELMEMTKCEIPILKIRRIKKYFGEGDFRPLPLVSITFAGTKLPSFVFIDYVRCVVEESKRKLVQCKNCLRYGHKENNCKSKPRCEICANDHPSGDCELGSSSSTSLIQASIQYTCIHCSGNHKASDPTCPFRKKQLKIWDLMCAQNISFTEAAKISKVSTTVDNIHSSTNVQPLQECSVPEHRHSRDPVEHSYSQKAAQQSKKSGVQSPSPPPSDLLFTPDINRHLSSPSVTFPKFDKSTVDAICALLKQLFSILNISCPKLDSVLETFISALPLLKSFFPTNERDNGY